MTSGVDFDIAIVGAGPAGTTTALTIAQEAPELGPRLVVVERARFPRDKPCAGALGGRGDALLAQLQAFVDVPGVWIDGVSFRGADGEAVAAPGRIGRVIRRTQFDHRLVEIARSRGVLVREGVSVRSVRNDERGGAVLDTTEGELRARAVVGCDGVGSVVRRALGLGSGRFRAQVIEVDTEPVRTDRDRSLLHFDASDSRLAGYAWDFPTLVSGRPLVCRGVYQIKSADVPSAASGVGVLLRERLLRLGIDPDRCENKRYAERGYDAVSRLSRGSLMLVGESAGVDIATGEGIAQAIEFGVLAGRFLARRFREARGAAVDVDGWHDEVAGSRLARDLRIRGRLLELFCGPARPRVDRLLTRSSDMLFVGCQHFAAQRYDWIKVGKTAVRGLVAVGPFGLTGLAD